MKHFMISICILFLTGCVTNTYNTPFVNSEETVNLDFGMSKDEVLYVMKEPLFVAYGDENEIIWVYEVRTVEVNSLISSSGQVTPRKDNSKTKHAAPIHRLALTFTNNRLTKWEPYSE